VADDAPRLNGAPSRVYVGMQCDVAREEHATAQVPMPGGEVARVGRARLRPLCSTRVQNAKHAPEFQWLRCAAALLQVLPCLLIACQVPFFSSVEQQCMELLPQVVLHAQRNSSGAGFALVPIMAHCHMMLRRTPSICCLSAGSGEYFLLIRYPAMAV